MLKQQILLFSHNYFIVRQTDFPKLKPEGTKDGFHVSFFRVPLRVPEVIKPRRDPGAEFNSNLKRILFIREKCIVLWANNKRAERSLEDETLWSLLGDYRQKIVDDGRGDSGWIRPGTIGEMQSGPSEVQKPFYRPV